MDIRRTDPQGAAGSIAFSLDMANLKSPQGGLAKSARAGQAVDLVDDHDIDFPGPQLGEKRLQGGAVKRGSGEAAIT